MIDDARPDLFDQAYNDGARDALEEHGEILLRWVVEAKKLHGSLVEVLSIATGAPGVSQGYWEMVAGIAYERIASVEQLENERHAAMEEPS